MVKVYQIYYDDDSKQRLEPEYMPYLNNPTSIFFESQVMCDLIKKDAHKNCEWFGVVSHRLRKKVQQSKFWGRSIANRSMRKFSPKEFEHYIRTNKADIASFCKHPSHAVFPWAEKYHPGICKATYALIRKLKYKVWYDQKSRDVIYFNYFLARPAIYADFVNTLLRPAINLMKNDKEIKALCKINSRYPKPVPVGVRDQTGYDYWPMFPFIAERLINLYLIKNNNKFSFIQW